MALILDQSYFHGNNVKKIAKGLLGKVLCTRINNILTSGLIVETEAYSFRERGCHAFDNLRTSRTEVMFLPGGIAYVYLCYGIHHLFNIVTNKADRAEAVLVRALEPREGSAHMLRRTNKSAIRGITSGPGKLTKALGIDRTMDGLQLGTKDLWVEDIGIKIAKHQVMATQRIGIDYAGEDADLPWRFYIKDNPWISRP